MVNEGKQKIPRVWLRLATISMPLTARPFSPSLPITIHQMLYTSTERLVSQLCKTSVEILQHMILPICYFTSLYLRLQHRTPEILYSAISLGVVGEGGGIGVREGLRGRDMY